MTSKYYEEYLLPSTRQCHLLLEEIFSISFSRMDWDPLIDLVISYLPPVLTNESIRQAISLWRKNEEDCFRKYGHISE